MNLAGLVSLLDSRALHLSRLDLLQDPHEGALPRPLVEGRDRLFEQEGIAHALIDIKAAAQRLRETCYVSCWAMNDYESEALWRLYGGNQEGVAIKSTYEALVEILNDDDQLYVGCVRYIDYESEWFPDGNVYYPVMHKRRAFAHENEVRLTKVMIPQLAGHEPIGPIGIKVPVDLGRLVNGIYINPMSQEWYAETVKSVVEKFAPHLAAKVKWSTMKAAPLY